MTRDCENAVKILDYWFSLEFLSQDKFPNYWENQNKVKKHKDNLAKGKSQYKTIETFILLQKEDVDKNLDEIILSEAKECGMTRWGNLTFYIGKVKREHCIECISKFLSFDSADDNRPERCQDRIAWASLQLSPEGNYVEHSLSLSTILWALNQIKLSNGNLSGVLDNKRYTLAVEGLEKKFFDKGTITLKKLQELYKEIENLYIWGNIEKTSDEDEAYEEIYGVSFQLFKDEETKSKKEDDNYLGLARDYFSNDIKMILDLAKRDVLAEDNFLGKDLQKYITTLTKNDTQIAQRLDVIKPIKNDLYTHQNNITELMKVENAPLGKWPSRFMPAFMQQMAINLAIGEGKSKIFSVNGPPGTGKTTLLKEIVVNNVVERACLLSEYDNPDDAFEQCNFIHGDKEECAYSSYTRHWYRIKNDKINNYSMLVTSCNNAAVENISKELPKSVLKDLNALAGDSDELKEVLADVARMFDPEQSNVFETTHQGELYSDLYFTLYAKALLQDDDVWGLIAAPLGKKTNLSNFYSRVLYPLSRDFYKNKDMAQNRVARYREAKKAFLEQLNIVKEQQKKVSAIEKLLQMLSAKDVESKKAKEDANISGARYEEIFAERESSRPKLLKSLTTEKSKQESCESAYNEVRSELQQKKHELQIARDRIKQALTQELSTRNSVGFFAKLFKSAKYQAAMALADEYGKDAEQQKQHEHAIELKIEQILKNEVAAKRLVDIAKNDVKKLEESISSLEDEVKEAERRKNEDEITAQRKEKEFLELKESVECKLIDVANASDLDKQVVINDEYINNLLSEEKDISTQAQVDNPWFTQRYNREREKLFILAMRMNKEFVISSNRCRDNFNTLSHYWGLKLGDENERIIFHKEDRERMVTSLLQTLFLFVPVVSSTFASVGALLRDVKGPGTIGLLVVDEAGQAQPQMAVGALYRSRKAIIVGDPKQVEPVVTDDLALLKNVYNDELLKPYKNKMVSVQGFADSLNLYGTYLDNGSDYPEWVGCPLVVHRRCISPMYDISNQLSYNGIMKQQTNHPKKEDVEKFIYERSRWINVVGKEKGNKNHFVEEQAKKVCELLEEAFTKNPNPSIYIISPFTTVVSGIKSYIKHYCKINPSTKIDEDYILDYDEKKTGTVHTFQGKEANEVIFVLGCDTSRESEGAIKWVNKNIVNVAATRAKYRLYVIGDEQAWRQSSCVSEAKQIMDTFAIKEIKAILEKDLPKEEEQKALLDASNSLPALTQFATVEVVGEDGNLDYSVDTFGLIRGLNEEFITTKLSEAQLGEFGFKCMDDLNVFSQNVKDNLVLGMKLYFLLEPVYKINDKMDASCCAILFCKAMELQMKECFTESLKKVLPDFMIRGVGKGRETVALRDAQNKELTLGTFNTIIKKNNVFLGQRMQKTGNMSYDNCWWGLFESRLSDCTTRRNRCCHSGLFSWDELSLLLYDMFKVHQTKSINGLIFESSVGKKI